MSENKSMSKITALLTLIVIFLGIITWYLYQNNQNNQTPQGQNQSNKTDFIT